MNFYFNNIRKQCHVCKENRNNGYLYYEYRSDKDEKRCYKYFQNNWVSWDEARAKCVKDGGYLLQLNEESKFQDFRADFLSSIVSLKGQDIKIWVYLISNSFFKLIFLKLFYYKLGAKAIEPYKFSWFDTNIKSYIDPTYFGLNLPDNGKFSCVGIDKLANNKLNNLYCYNRHSFICEYPKMLVIFSLYCIFLICLYKFR